MAKKKKPAEITEQKQEQELPPEDLEFRLISLDLIDDPEAPMRSDINEGNVEDLVLSIKQVGIIEPLVVKHVNARFEVIAGHRRLYASRLAKVAQVPCYVRKANNEQTEMLKIHENLYRAEISPADEARHFQYLVDKQKLSPGKIAQLISKSLTYVTDRLEILEYPDFLKEAMDNGQISFSVAKEFSRFSDINQMRSAVYYARRGGMTAEMARKWVQDHKREKEQPVIQTQNVYDNDTQQMEEQHTATCVYCQQGLRLIEAEVVYMHSACLRAANTPTDTPEVSSL